MRAHLTQMGTTEQFVVSMLRLWALPHCDPTRLYPDWRQGFESSGLGLPGASNFDAMCRILAAAAPNGLAIHELQCAQLGADEAQLLHTLWLLQEKQLCHAHRYLEDWCGAAAARVAIGPAATCSLLLQSQRMRVNFHYAVAGPKLIH